MALRSDTSFQLVSYTSHTKHSQYIVQLRASLIAQMQMRVYMKNVRGNVTTTYNTT